MSKDLAFDYCREYLLKRQKIAYNELLKQEPKNINKNKKLCQQ